MQLGHREHERATYRKPVRVQLVDGRVLGAQALDISEGGISVQIDEPLPQRTLCKLTILHANAQGDPVPIEVVGEVRYQVMASGGRARLGIKFMQVHPGSKSAFDRLIMQLLPATAG